jgi:oligoribonuclease NrnB/cAMP/cGMP phosphodiesterase (DHH superfamily)
MKNRIVIYHANCVDGWTAAWAVWLKFGDEDTEYVPASYGDAPPPHQGRDVVIVDFSYPRETLSAMHEEAKSLIVLDHHRTAREALADLPYALFDMERSGAGMAWDHFHGTRARPWLVDYVEDRDLWRFALPKSKEVSAWLSAQTRTAFQAWLDLEEGGRIAAIERGTAVLVYLDRYVSEMAQQARTASLEGYDSIPIVNAPYINTSEVVGHLAESAPFAVGWFQRKDGVYQYSLRSRGEVDVSEIAKRYGGGGHKGAAGFTSDRQLW